MKRWTIFLIVVAMVAFPLGPGEARHRHVADSYTVSALPWVWMEDRRPDRCGIEGVSKDTHPFEAPFAGNLSVTMRFAGNWDLYLTDADGQLIDSGRTGEFSPSPTQPNQEEVSLFVPPGEKVHIVACNFMGAEEAEVEYTLVHARPPVRSQRLAPMVEKASYSAPAGVSPIFDNPCLSPEAGCARFAPPAGSSSVLVSIKDDASPRVAGEVRQFGPQTRYRHQLEFCGAVKVPLLPRVHTIVVLVQDGICAGGAAAVATHGVITVTFR